MVKKLRFFSWLLALALPLNLCAQSDTLTLFNGRVVVGSYRVSYNHQQVESKTNINEVYQAKDVQRLSTSKHHFRTVNIDVQGETHLYMAERLFDSEVSLYGLDLPSGHFNANSAAQSFFFFEKDGVLTYVNKANLEGFYATYFGNCYGGIPDKKLHYNEGSIIKMLNAYNKCQNPDAVQKEAEPTLSEMNLSVFGGVGNLTHYPLNVAFNEGRFADFVVHSGLGLNFVVKKKVSLGLELRYAAHDMSSPVFISSYVGNGPNIINAVFKTLGGHLSAAYIMKFKKLALMPGASIGAGKILGYDEELVQPEFFINTRPFTIEPNAKNLFAFEELFYDLKAFANLSYELGPKFSLFANGGFNLIFTKSLVGEDAQLGVAKEGNHAIDGVLFGAGIIYKIKG